MTNPPPPSFPPPPPLPPGTRNDGRPAPAPATGGGFPRNMGQPYGQPATPGFPPPPPQQHQPPPPQTPGGFRPPPPPSPWGGNVGAAVAPPRPPASYGAPTANSWSQATPPPQAHRPLPPPSSFGTPAPPPPPASFGGFPRGGPPTGRYPVYQSAQPAPPSLQPPVTPQPPQPPPGPGPPRHTSHPPPPPPPVSAGYMGVPPSRTGGRGNLSRYPAYPTAPPPPPRSGPPSVGGFQPQPQPPAAPSATGARPLAAAVGPAYPPPPAATSAMQASRGGLDPTQIPHPPLFTRPQEEPIPIFFPKAAMEGTSAAPSSAASVHMQGGLHPPPPPLLQLPPPADSRFLVEDDGNASPELIRSSVYRFPISRNLWHNTGDLPLGVLCTPLRLRSEDFAPRPPVVPDAIVEASSDQSDEGGPTALSPTVPLVSLSASTMTNTGSGLGITNSASTKSGIAEGLAAATSSALAIASSTAAAISGSSSNSEPPRCTSCSAYVNPFFGADGTCNFCKSRNRSAVLSSGASPTDAVSVARQCGTVEYEVSGPYVTRDTPVQPVFLYAIDLASLRAELSGILRVMSQLARELAAHAARQQQSANARQQAQPAQSHPGLFASGTYGAQSGAYRGQPAPVSTSGPAPPPWHPQIGICFFCASGIFVRQRHVKEDPGRYAFMPDMVNDPFCHLPVDAWTFDLSSKEELEDCLSYLEKEANDDLDGLRKQAGTKIAQKFDALELSCGGAALTFLADALRSTGGRGTVLSGRRPNFGVGAIPHREEKLVNGMHRGSWRASNPLQIHPHLSADEKVAGTFYQNLASQCSKDRISMSYVILSRSSAFFDLATLGEFCRVTCGELHWINTVDWEQTLLEEFGRSVLTFYGTDAVFKLRCSSGLQVKGYMSGCGTLLEGGIMGTPELELASVSSNATFAVELEHRVGGISKESKHVFVQSALVYTTPTGQRRVRVSTLALRTSTSAHEVFRSVDFSATTTLFLRSSLESLHKVDANVAGNELDLKRLKTREALSDRCILLLSCYRSSTAAMSAPSTQLILPEKMQLFPLFCMALLKSPLLRPGLARRMADSQQIRLSPTADERAFFGWHVGRATPATSFLLTHPNVFPVNTKETVSALWKGGENAGDLGVVKMPSSLIASMATLKDDEVYLVDNGLAIFLVVGKSAPEKYRKSNAASLMDNSTESMMIWQLKRFTSLSMGAESDVRPTCAPVIPVIRSDTKQGLKELEVLSLMVDDAVCGEKDFPNFLINLHHKVRQRVEGTKK